MNCALQRPGRVFILSGPSGVGKNTIADVLCERGEAVRAVTATTREPRPGESDGEDYYFVNRQEFDQWREQGRFLEHNEYAGNLYGTPAFSVNEATETGLPVLLVIDVNGALAIKTQCPDVTLIFVKPPRMSELEKRLKKRGESDGPSLERRLERAREEMACAPQYDHVVVNDQLDVAVEKVAEILNANVESRTGNSQRRIP
jgi:guanylate kinase